MVVDCSGKKKTTITSHQEEETYLDMSAVSSRNGLTDTNTTVNIELLPYDDGCLELERLTVGVLPPTMHSGYGGKSRQGKKGVEKGIERKEKGTVASDGVYSKSAAYCDWEQVLLVSVERTVTSTATHVVRTPYGVERV